MVLKQRRLECNSDKPHPSATASKRPNRRCRISRLSGAFLFSFPAYLLCRGMISTWNVNSSKEVLASSVTSFWLDKGIKLSFLLIPDPANVTSLVNLATLDMYQHETGCHDPDLTLRFRGDALVPLSFEMSLPPQVDLHHYRMRAANFAFPFQGTYALQLLYRGCNASGSFEAGHARFVDLGTFLVVVDGMHNMTQSRTPAFGVTSSPQTAPTKHETLMFPRGLWLSRQRIGSFSTPDIQPMIYSDYLWVPQDELHPHGPFFTRTVKPYSRLYYSDRVQDPTPQVYASRDTIKVTNNALIRANRDSTTVCFVGGAEAEQLHRQFQSLQRDIIYQNSNDARSMTPVNSSYHHAPTGLPMKANNDDEEEVKAPLIVTNCQQIFVSIDPEQLVSRKDNDVLEYQQSFVQYFDHFVRLVRSLLPVTETDGSKTNGTTTTATATPNIWILTRYSGEGHHGDYTNLALKAMFWNRTRMLEKEGIFDQDNLRLVDNTDLSDPMATTMEFELVRATIALRLLYIVGLSAQQGQESDFYR